MNESSQYSQHIPLVSYQVRIWECHFGMAADGEVGHPSMFQVTSNAEVQGLIQALEEYFFYELNCFPSYMDCTEIAMIVMRFIHP